MENVIKQLTKRQRKKAQGTKENGYSWRTNFRLRYNDY